MSMIHIWATVSDGAIHRRYIAAAAFTHAELRYYQSALISVGDDIELGQILASSGMMMQMVSVPIDLLRVESADQAVAVLSMIDEMLLESPPMSTTLPDLDSPLI